MSVDLFGTWKGIEKYRENYLIRGLNRGIFRKYLPTLCKRNAF